MNAEGGAGGGGTNIHLEFEEMIAIANKLKSICDIYTEGVQPEIKKLVESDFYQAGQAMKTIKSYSDILGKTMELFDNYSMAAQIVNYAMEKMYETDKELQKLYQIQK
ncbi:hypothetical protein [Bacillus sonorensis]|uniref:hypothetical protein n=1 Tax=Bacillus sonorensis TaxID=119858 RepID=UPI00227E5F66|nr:hypothetical protein [Bacillus sonorensis]MCY8273131.1 hypothetical protein [Bacillus sonorensis]MCY8606324.1 hypothetical protein [Bacillus sonorensis]MEC1534688.1 hypothetical protein [Bacillus sonorensis]